MGSAASAQRQWSWLFFGQHRPGMALLNIVLLLAAIVGFIIVAWAEQRILPYPLVLCHSLSLG
jgi:tryptophan-rich sensory protein